MLKFLKNYLWLIVMIMSLALLIFHTLSLKTFNIDSISLVLLVIIMISPFINHVKRIKFGDFEAEINSKEVQKVTDEVESSLANSEVEVQTNNFREILELDPVLALAKLRIELEKNISKLYANYRNDNNKNENFNSLGKIVYELTIREILPVQISNPLKEIIYFCNAAIHGKEVDKSDAKKIIDSGIIINNNIIAIIQEYIVGTYESIVVSQQEVSKYRDVRYKVTSIIPYVENPKKNIRILNQEGLDELLEGYDEYAEFLVGIEIIDD